MMEQAIKKFKAAYDKVVECELKVTDIWNEYTELDEDDMKAKKRLLNQRAAVIARCGNLSQKRNIAEAKMIEAIVKS